MTAVATIEAAGCELSVLLVDDEPLALEGLRLVLQDLEGVRIAGALQDPSAVMPAVAIHRPDVLLLDIQMPGLSGMDLARQLGGPTSPDVIFVTAHHSYAPQAFDVEAADFVLKPIDPGRLREALIRAGRRKALRQMALSYATSQPAAPPPTAEQVRAYVHEFWVPHREGTSRVPIGRIDWIEAARDYVLLHTALRTHILRTTMARLERELDPQVMLRVHRSAFVNASSVVEIVHRGPGVYALQLAGGAEVRVGRMYASSVLASLQS